MFKSIVHLCRGFMAAGKAISPVGSKWQEDEHFSYNNTLVLRERAGGSTAGGGQL